MNNPQHPSRHGTLIICVLVCMGITTTVMSLSIAGAVRSHRSIKKTQQLRQTDYLLDAGVLRSAQRLRQSIDYRGETWKPSSRNLTYLNPTVVISVEKRNAPPEFVVNVVATLGANEKIKIGNQHLTTKRTYQFTYALDQAQPSN